MTSPEELVEPRSSRRRSVSGVVAYVLVPGEHRRRAAGHFRRAGLELMRGVGALARPEKLPDVEGPARRERIEIE
jgi:hypothetical protein